ncbi:lipoate--protein ligase family protein [Pseudalkalibacillus decolorationis]|uniref:lipoate--protein ligase family protein n=1 Tax=Pseudalkalibacillus decolorationis TaxID=163879 RepID=UPI00214837C4|nr:lipoate--protein ligase family protein [Pseudalkalibacillus decolorationis]
MIKQHPFSTELFKQPTWRIIDQTTLGSSFHALQSFAMDDTLCTSIGSEDSPPTVRSWVHPRTVVLGIQDSRLPHLSDGVQYLKDHGYEVIVRNSGGLAVVLDEGVLNLSLIVPEIEKKIDIDSGYEALAYLTEQLLSPYGITFETKEITTSYCPGKFDLSVGGRKFAGISQRRLRGGVAVQIYLCVTGSGSARAELIKGFYERSLQTTETKFTYPSVDPKVMASLAELTEEPIQISDLMKELFSFLKDQGSELMSSQLTISEINLYDFYLKRVIERNEKAIDPN